MPVSPAKVEPSIDPVAPDSLEGIPRQQSNASRWQGKCWPVFCEALAAEDIQMDEQLASVGAYRTDAGGVAQGLPHGVVLASNNQQLCRLMKLAQLHAVPVTIRGGGLTTEGESVAYGGVLLDLSSMNEVLELNAEAKTVCVQGGILWHRLAEYLRRFNLDYLSAPLNMASSVGGTLGVGGIDVNSSKHGCSADQALALTVVTPTGELVECNDDKNVELFQRVILGYGQFGIIAEATLKVRVYTPMHLEYYYYASLKDALADLRLLDRLEVCDYTGILTMMDKAITLLVGFDSDERKQEFQRNWQHDIKGVSEWRFGIILAAYYGLHPWRFRELFFLLRRKTELFPDLMPPQHMRDGKLLDRTVVFSRAVWKHWGHRNMVIPDLATNADKITEAVLRGNEVCKRYFPYYTLYCVGIKTRPEHEAHYEMSAIPTDGDGWVYGCEFEPMMERNLNHSRDYLQSFKNEIYDIGVDLKTTYYRFGGVMKAYIRRALGDKVVDKHLALKKEADPAMILNRDVIF